MLFSQLPAEDAALRRYVEDLRLPYQRELAETVESFGLVEDTDLADAEVEFVRGRLESDDFRVVVAVDSEGESAVDAPTETAATVDIATTDATLAGFVTTERDEAPEVFTRPDRLIVCDLYVRDRYRGEGVADELMTAVGNHADEVGCPEVVLDVDVDNERAKRFYEKQGFEPLRTRLLAETDEIR